MSERVDEYISDSEEVKAVSSGVSRTFAVTDRRILDVSEVETSDGRTAENIRSTLFTNVVSVDLSIHGSTTNTDTGKAALGILMGLVGLLIGVAGVANGGSAAAIGILIGLVGIGIGVWLLMNATERISGGIRVELQHVDEELTDEYLLPEDQDGTARAVLRAVGGPHSST